MKMLGVTLRVLALACLAASLPAACLKYPWFPATVQEFAELRVDPYPSGTASYHAERAQRRERLAVALTLYALGTLSLVGLALIACRLVGRRTEAASWAIVMVTGVGVALFERPTLGPGADRMYVVATFDIPLGVAAVAVVGSVLSVAEIISERPRRTGSR